MDIRQQNIIKYSNEILDYLLLFKDINPDFTFSLRQRDSAQTKDIKRLEAGQWFQGSDYIYIPLFKKGDNARKVKTIGFVIGFDNEGKIKKNSIEISFKAGITDEKEISFHRQLAKKFDILLNDNNHGEKLFDNHTDIYTNLEYYLNEFRNQALAILGEFGINNKYIISKEEFDRNLNRIENIKNENAINYWIFQGNPKVYDFETALRKEILTDWTVSAHKEKIKIGDKVILYIGGKNAGCYALAKITSQPYVKKYSADNHLWKDIDKNELKAGIKITHNLVSNPIYKSVIDSHESLKNLKVGSQGTNFSATKEEYETLVNLSRLNFRDLNNETKINQMALNQILYGPPGTGKTYNSINKAIEIINPDFDLSQDRIILKKEYDRLVAENQILFTTFHQSMSYEDFIEGIKPETKDKNVIYDVVPGLFLEICTTAENNWEDAKEGNSKKLSFEEAFLLLKEEWFENEEIKFPLKREGNDFTIIGFTKKSIQFKKASGGTGHTLSIGSLKDYYYNKKEFKPTGVGIYYPSILEKLNKYQPKIISEKAVKNYVIIIDEINRGNVSQIFGELITLIEDSKRLGNDEALEVILPYSKEKFGVPPNLYIIGTMNTADRSVEALDTALRRRFSFVEMMPQYDLKELENEVFGYQLKDILKTINKRIIRLLNNDHAIGHSYFLNKDEKSLITSFNNNIIPLLQEYFFGDYGKMRLVLGDGFIQFDEWNEEKEDKFFASVADSKTDYDIKDLYSIIEYKQDNKVGFSDALSKLMNR